MTPSRHRRARLAALAGGHVAVGVAGAAVALTRGHAYSIGPLRGEVRNVRRDSVVWGTALSAPAWLLGVEGLLLVRQLRGSGDSTARLLGALGGVTASGYLAERLVRHRLTPSGWEPLESSVALVGLALSFAMARAGFNARAGSSWRGSRP